METKEIIKRIQKAERKEIFKDILLASSLVGLLIGIAFICFKIFEHSIYF